MKSEHTIQSEIMLAVSRANCTIIRTNVGRVITRDGRPFDAGPPKGWPDLTGMVKSTGQIILIEVKNEHGKLREDQKRFAEMVKNQVPNAIYGVCRSADDAIELINEGVKHDEQRILDASKEVPRDL